MTRNGQNVGLADALLRGVLAIVLVVLGVSGQVHGLLSFVAVLGGLILMATALTRECPLYRVLHVATAGTAAPRARRG